MSAHTRQTNLVTYSAWIAAGHRRPTGTATSSASDHLGRRLWIAAALVAMCYVTVAPHARDAVQPSAALVGILAVACAAAVALLVVSPWHTRAYYHHTADALTSLTPSAFERYVADLFLRAGYRVEHMGASGDGGVDIRVWRDDHYGVVQCKRYLSGHAVGPATIRELVGSRTHEGADMAWLATTGRLTAGARKLASEEQIRLLDAQSLAAWDADLRRWRRLAHVERHAG